MARSQPFSFYPSSLAMEQTNVSLIARIVVSSLLIALCAQIRIPLPFTPVPITFQTFAVMLIGAKLGSRAGAAAVLVYLAEVMLGLPVLNGWKVNHAALIGPTGGYLIGFVAQAYIAGWLVERRERYSDVLLFFGLLASGALSLFLGAMLLSHFVGIGNAFYAGVMPFIPGDVLKTLFVLEIIRRRSL